MLNVAWEEEAYKVYNPFLYVHFCAGSGSGGVVCKLYLPRVLVHVAVDLFFSLREISVVGSLGGEKQDVCHVIGFIDEVRHVY